MEVKENKFKPLVKLDLQYFADPDPKDPIDPQDPKAGDPKDPDPNTTPKGADKTFTQEEVDELIKQRLQREKRKAEEKAEEARKEAEKKALIEQEKYKELYETLQEELATQKAENLSAKRDALMAGAGYSAEQIERYRKFVDGDNEEAIKQSLEELKVDLPPKGGYVDPQLSNPKRQDPKQEDLYDVGKELFAKLKAKGRV